MGRSKSDRNTNNYFFTKFSNFPLSFYDKSNLSQKYLGLKNIFDGELVSDVILGQK